jgi:hypothetical protein
MASTFELERVGITKASLEKAPESLRLIPMKRELLRLRASGNCLQFEDLLVAELAVVDVARLGSTPT